MHFAIHFALAAIFLTIPPQSIAGCDRCTDSYRICIANAKGTSFEIQSCQTKEEEIQEARLNTSFQRALKRLTPERQKELRGVQKSWLAYRLAASRYYVDSGLSGYKILSSDRHLKLTAERISELNGIDY
ncbi:lysozyme inhibitor LprI family protein [Azonexus sp.]|uniref:lysozyme inhibitor LprI family protein n=1 Tax=Azonexus sp. TaxID=1872668 RepID=UPI0027BA4190|nr:lysozyme inhibitor LprI family protein [Azonexus sp.]